MSELDRAHQRSGRSQGHQREHPFHTLSLKVKQRSCPPLSACSSGSKKWKSELKKGVQGRPEWEHLKLHFPQACIRGCAQECPQSALFVRIKIKFSHAIKRIHSHSTHQQQNANELEPHTLTQKEIFKKIKLKK